MKKPNLLFVFADQMRAMDMGCAGNPDILTPHLDRLAAGGRRFTQAVANTPVCGPNRASLLSGMYPPHVGVPFNDLPLKLGTPTLGTIAQANGYQTGYIGKWHLDGLLRDKFTPPGERRFGFDYWAAFNCFHDYFTPRYFRDTPEMIRPGGYEPIVQTDLAIDFITQTDRSRPFALVLSWGPPHDPYQQVPPSYRSLYDADSLTLRPNADPTANNPLVRGRDCRQTYAEYYAAITVLDEQMGRLMATLDSLALTEETLVVFTSDHGDMLWSHGLMKKQIPYQESIQVPLLIHQPGTVEAGTVSQSLLGSIDILPTLSGALGWKHDVEFDGKNLAATFSSDALREEPLLIANYVSMDEDEKQGIGEWRGVYTGAATYVEKTSGQPWLLFDNDADPYQQNNLVNQPAANSDQDKLGATLRDLLAKSGDAFSPVPELVSSLGLTNEWQERSKPKYSAETMSELQAARKRFP